MTKLYEQLTVFTGSVFSGTVSQYISIHNSTGLLASEIKININFEESRRKTLDEKQLCLSHCE